MQKQFHRLIGEGTLDCLEEVRVWRVEAEGSCFGNSCCLTSFHGSRRQAGRVRVAHLMEWKCLPGPPCFCESDAGEVVWKKLLIRAAVIHE